MAFEAGSVFVKLGALLDKGGFDQYDRALDGARANARRGATAKLDADTKEGEAKIARLTAAIKAVEKEKATAQTDVEIAGAVAKLKILQHELDKTGRQTATKKLEGDFKSLGLAAQDLEGVFGGGGGGGKGLVGTIGGFFKELPLLGKAAVAVLPAINGLAGGLTALVGSLGGAGLGAGAVGVAGFGGLAVGIGSIVAVAKPAANDIKEVNKAFAAYNDTLSKFGPKDPATIKAQQDLNRVVGEHGGKAVLDLIKQTKAMGTEWKKQTTSARDDMTHIMSGGIKTVEHDMSTFSGVTNRIWDALGQSMDRTFKVLRGGEFRRDIRAVGDTFTQSMDPLFRGFDHLILYFGRIARFSGGELVNLVKGFEHWAAALDRGSRDTDKLSRNLGDLFGHMHAWIDLTKSLGHLLATILKGGADEGEGLVVTLTHVLDKWNAFLNTPKGQQDMRTFFHDSVELTKTLFHFLAQGSGAILQIANNLMPAWIAAAKILNATLVPIIVGISKLIGEHKGLTNLVAGFIAMNVALKLVRGTMALLMVDMKALTGTKILGGLLGRGGGAAGAEGAAAGGAGGLLARGLRGLGSTGGLAGLGGLAGSKGLSTLGTDLTGGLGKGLLSGVLRASIWGDIGIGITRGIFTGFHKGVSTGAMEALHSITLGLTPKPKDFEKQDRVITDDIDRINSLANQAARARKLGINIDVNFKKDVVNQGVNDVLSSLERMRKGTASSVHGARSDLQLQMKLIANTMGTQSNQGKDAMAAAFRATAAEVKRGMDRGVISTREGTKEINRLMREALKVYGITGGQASLYLAGRDTLTGKNVHVTPGSHQGLALGGWVGHRGERGYDEIPMSVGGQPIVVGRGEAMLDGPRPAVVNRHQQEPVEVGLAVSKAMGVQPYGSLDELFAGVQTPHYAAKGGRVGHYATGGRTNEYGGVSGPVAALIHELDAKGFRHGSTTDGQHAPGGFHPRGMAVDYGDATNNMQRLWSLLYPKRNQFAELFGPAYLKPKPTLMHFGAGFNDAGLQSQHDDHIHIALAQALAGAVGMARKVLPRLRVGGPQSALRTIVQGGLDATRNAAQTRLDGAYDSLTSDAAGTTNEPGGGKAAPAGQVRNWLTQALRATGHFSAGNLNALFGRVLQESGGNPKAINLWDSNAKAGHPSKGLLQTIDSTFNSFKMRGHGNIWDPVDNAIAAIRYMFATYGHIVGASSTGYATGGFTRGSAPHTRAGNPLATIARRLRPTKKVARKPKARKPVVVRPPHGHVRTYGMSAPRRYSGFAGAALKGLDDLQGVVDSGEKDYNYYSSIFGQTDEEATITLGDADAWFYSGYTKYDATKDAASFAWQPGDEMVNSEALVRDRYFDGQGNIVGGQKVAGISQHVSELDQLIGIRERILGAEEAMGKTSNQGLDQVQQWGVGATWQMGEWRDRLIKWVRKLRGDREDVSEVQGETKALGARYQAIVHAIREKYKKRRHQIQNANEQQAFSKAGMTQDMQTDVNREEQAALDVIKGGKGSPLLKSQRSAEIRKTYKARRESLADRAREASFGERMNKKNALWLLSQGESNELYNEQSHNKEVGEKRAEMLKGLQGDVSRDIKNRDTLKAALRGLLSQMGETDPGLLSKWDSMADKFPAEDYGGDIKAPSAEMKNSTKGIFLQKIADLTDTLRTERDVTIKPLKDERDEWLAASDKHPRAPGQGTNLQGLAESAASQLASFQQSRADLFSNFGSNFVPAALRSSYFGDPTAQAAGFRYFGATGASAASNAGIDPAGGTQQSFTQNNYYQVGPEDPHIHAQVSRIEFQSAFG